MIRIACMRRGRDSAADGGNVAVGGNRCGGVNGGGNGGGRAQTRAGAEANDSCRRRAAANRGAVADRHAGGGLRYPAAIARRRSAAHRCPCPVRAIRCSRSGASVRAQRAIAEAAVVHLYRRGDIFEIIDKNDNRDDYYGLQAPWYLVDRAGRRGWAFGEHVDTYCYQYQAELRTEFFRRRTSGG